MILDKGAFFDGISQLPDGTYHAQIRGYIYELKKDKKRIKWDLALINDNGELVEKRIPNKHHYVETDGGLSMLFKEMSRVLDKQIKSIEQVQDKLEDMVGVMVEVEVLTEEDNRNVYFVRRIE